MARTPGKPQSPESARSAPRNTATFEPYFWEAYSQIARPDKFDWYLVTRWLPELGALGFAIVKALRTLCYFNPKDGVLRDSVELDTGELAAMVGTSRPTLYRELERNTALAHFVERQEQVGWKGDRPVKILPRFRVCMDTPIHPDDRERYDELRARKECDRQEREEGTEAAKGRIRVLPRPTKTPDGRKSQSEICAETPCSQIENSELPYSQFETRKSQIETPYSQSETTYKESSLPPDLFTKDISTSATNDPPINPPRGKEEPNNLALSFDPLQATWNVALSHLAEIVNAPTLNAHLKPMRLASVTDVDHDGVVSAEAVLIAPTAFAKTWIEGHNKSAVEAALGEALGRAVIVKITTGGK